MVLKRIFYNTPLLLLLALSPAYGVVPAPTFNFNAIYDLRITGVPIGRMGIEMEQEASHYAVVSDITLVGLAKAVSNHSSHTIVEASGNNREYESRYRTKKKSKSVLMVYKDGALVKEDVQPLDNRATRPAVSDAAKNTAYDPLSFILKMRENAAKQQSSFVLNVYDGRRLTEATFTAVGKKNVRMDGKKISAIAYSVKRKPLEGFTTSEIDDWSPKEPPLFVYFSDDGRMIPFKLEIAMWYGTLTAELAKECRTGESCLLGIRE